MSHTTRIPQVLAATVGSLLLANVAVAKPAAERDAYKDVVVPVLRAKCYQCHADEAQNPSGKKKIKGKLELTTIEAIKKGGDTDAGVVSGKPDESLIIELIRLPHDDDEHMPPEGKPQIEAHELKVLEWWITAGLPSGKNMKDAGAPGDIIAAADKIPTDDQIGRAHV